MKIGINVMVYPGDRNPIDNAVQAEAEGFESIWMTDGGGRMDALTSAAAIGARTSRIRIGLGIVPVFNRPPAVLAASAAALSHIAPDRVVLGVGSSSQTMIERWYGMTFEKPLTGCARQWTWCAASSPGNAPPTTARRCAPTTSDSLPCRAGGSRSTSRPCGRGCSSWPARSGTE